MTARSTDRPSLERAGEYPGVVTVSTWKNIGICSWTGGAIAPAVDTLIGVMDKLRASAPLSWIHLIQGGVPLPDSAARSGFIRIMKERESEIACAAIVVGGTGFWASAMRNAVIGLRVLTPRSFEYRLHGTRDEVLLWLPEAHRQKTGVEISPEFLGRLLAQVQNQ